MNKEEFLSPSIPIVYPIYLHGDIENEHENKIVMFFRFSGILSNKILIAN